MLLRNCIIFLVCITFGGQNTNADSDELQPLKSKGVETDSNIKKMPSLPSFKGRYSIKRIFQTAFSSGSSSAVAGSVQVLSLMWLKTIVNYQYRYGGSISKAVTELYNQGGLSRFYRGLSFAIIQGPLGKYSLTVRVCNIVFGFIK